MAAAQPCGDFFCPCGCGGYLGFCELPLPSLRAARVPRIALPYLDFEDPFPTTPPGFLTMPEDDPIDRFAPTMPSTEREPEAVFPETERPTNPENHLPRQASQNPLPEATKGDSYFAGAARDFAAALVELRATRESIESGFQSQEKSAKQTRREVNRAARAATANHAILRREFSGLRDSLQTFRRETDERFTALEEKVAKLEAEAAVQRDLADRLERETRALAAQLADWKAARNEPAPSAAAPSTAP